MVFSLLIAFGLIRATQANGVWPVRAEAAKRPNIRNELYLKTRFLKEGMSKREVRDLLGEPDDVVDFNLESYPTSSLWAYGTLGHKTLPTLGVFQFFGDSYADFNFSTSFPPPEGMFDEGTLRSLMRQVDWSYYTLRPPNVGDPLATIRATTALWHLGKEHALAVVREVARVQQNFAETAHLMQILLSLFGDDDYKRAFRNEGPMSAHPFDLVVSHGIPFSLGMPAGGFSGNPVELSRTLAFFESKGVLVKRLVQPTNDIGLVLDEFERGSGRDGNPDGRNSPRGLITQLLLLVRTAVPLSPRLFDGSMGTPDWPPFEKLLRSLKKKGLFWNSKDARYELPGQKPIDPVGFTNY